MLVVWSGFVIGGLVALGARAVANGYLLVMYWKRHGLYLLERGSDGRYHLFRTYLLPLVLLRYLVFVLSPPGGGNFPARRCVRG